MYTTRLTPPAPYRTLVTARGKGLQLAGASKPVTVTRVTQGLRGAPGSSGQAQISADPGNRLTQGSDQRLYVPPSTGDLTYTHQQSSASSQWLVDHGMGKYPSVTVVDSAGDQVEGDVEYVDTSSLRIVFSAAFAGRAYLN